MPKLIMIRLKMRSLLCVFLTIILFGSTHQTEFKCTFTSAHLDCSNKNLTQPPDSATWEKILSLTNYFKRVDFHSNSIKYLKPLPELNVTQLNFSNNLIEKIDMGAFRQIHLLKSLDLSHNRIRNEGLLKDRVEDPIFHPLMNSKIEDNTPKYAVGVLMFLVKLNLSHNMLSSIYPEGFVWCPNLQVLSLAANQFEKIDKDTEFALRSLLHLKVLDLSNNRIKTFGKYLFINHLSLRQLDLTNNEVSHIPEALNNTKLHKLMLDGNPIVTLDPHSSATSLLDMQFLSISNMPHLNTIKDEVFSKMSNLKTLIISNNPKLKLFSGQAFWSFSETNSSILPNRKIHLERLSLYNNSLENLDERLLYNWNVSEIDLQYNDWACSDDDAFLINTLSPQIKKRTPHLTENLYCKDSMGRKIHISEVAKEFKVNINDNSGTIHITTCKFLIWFSTPLIILYK